jgi:hypothetical protein
LSADKLWQLENQTSQQFSIADKFGSTKQNKNLKLASIPKITETMKEIGIADKQ